MVAFGLSIAEAWTMTVPDFWMLVDARRRQNAPPEGKGAGPKKFTPAEVASLRALMDDRGGQKWRTV